MKWSVWAGVFALLVQALLPAMLHAAAPKNAYLSEICTVFGIKKVVTADTDSSGISSHSRHCPVCALADSLVLPVSRLALPGALLRVFGIPHPAASQEYAAVRLSLHLRGPPMHA